MECESTACHELKEELSRVQGDLKPALEEKNVAMAELEQKRATSQEGMDGLWRDLEQALAERDEVENQADDDIERLQNDVQLFKDMKYKEGYHDGAQGKLVRYPLGNEEVVVQKTFDMPTKMLVIPVDVRRN